MFSTRLTALIEFLWFADVAKALEATVLALQELTLANKAVLKKHACEDTVFSSISEYIVSCTRGAF
jgi:hypothetical protein